MGSSICSAGSSMGTWMGFLFRLRSKAPSSSMSLTWWKRQSTMARCKPSPPSRLTAPARLMLEWKGMMNKWYANWQGILNICHQRGTRSHVTIRVLCLGNLSSEISFVHNQFSVAEWFWNFAKYGSDITILCGKFRSDRLSAMHG